ncbi:MAG: hypothetical protein NC307_11940 [Roseburia sp.]|nr:hypothetical protein [Roseburia sp.]
MFHNKKFIAAAAGFLLLFALVTGVLYFFFQPKTQIGIAAYATFKNSQWISVLRQSEFLKNDDLSADIKWNSGSVTGKLNVKFTGEETGISFRTGILGASVEIQGVLSDKTAKLKIPMAGDVIYTHSIEEETPFFDELFGSRNAKSIDKVLENLSGFRWKKLVDAGANSGAGRVDARGLAGMLKDIDIEKAEPRTLDIDGEEVSCKGYVLNLSGSVLEKEAGWSIGKAWVYLYRGKLASVRFPAGEEFFEIRFLGGENRDSNLMFIKEGEFYVTVKGQQEGEDFPISIVFENSEESHIALRGTLEKDVLNAEIRSAEIRGRDCRLEGDLSIVSGAEPVELNGEIMDLEHLPDTQKQILLAVFRLFRIS